MVQAAVLDGEFLDLSSPFDDGGVASEIGIARRAVGNVSSPFFGRPCPSGYDTPRLNFALTFPCSARVFHIRRALS